MVVTQLEATMNMMAVKYVPGMMVMWRKFVNFQFHMQVIYRHCKDKCTVSAYCLRWDCLLKVLILKVFWVI